MSTEHNTESVVENKTDIEEPSMYRCVLHNDNYTTMEFVTEVLMLVFNKDIEQAKKIMLTVHVEGKAVIGIYPKDIAETRANKTVQVARLSGYPLKCTAEKV